MNIKKSKYLFIGVFSFLTILLIFFFLKFVFVSEEEKIERMILTAKSAFEREDPELLVGFVSEEYKDDLGFDRNGIRQGLYDAFSLFDGIKVNLSKLEVNVKEGEAQVQFNLWVLAKNQDQPVFLVGSFNNPVPANFSLQKEGEEWKIIRFTFLQ